MRQPTVSVIISSYNYGRFIGATIESVLAQTLPAHEIIVIDDGSSDDSAAVVKSFGSRVKFIQQENQGVCAVRNKGAKMATGEILAFLDSDDIWLPRKLELQAEAFTADAEVGLVSCGLREFDVGGETICEYSNGKSGWCAREILLFRDFVLNTTASAIAVRREVFERVGGFDESREIFAAEDYELCYRIAKISKLHFVPEVLVDFRIHGKNGHLNIPQMERAMMAAYKKIFAGADAESLATRHESYGNLHHMLAGSYFRAKNYPAFLRHAARSFWLTPGNISRFAGFPVRWWKRNRSSLAYKKLY